MSSGRPPTLGPRARVAVLLATVSAALFFAGTLAAPWLDRAGSRWGTALRMVYAPVCHQQVERSIGTEVGPQAVCARCSGLYAGGVLGLAVAGVWLAGGRRPRPTWLLLAVVPTVVDALLPWIGLTGLPNVPRLLLAVPAGGVAALFLAAGVADLFSPDRKLPATGVYAQLPRALEDLDG